MGRPRVQARPAEPDAGTGGGPDAAVAGEKVPKSERTRQRILDCAARVFREQGYSARLSDIADAAGMQAGSLYYHFDGREDLVEEVLQRGIDMAWGAVRSALDELPPDASPRDRLATAIRAHAEAILETSDYSAAHSRIFSMATPAVRARNYALQQQYGDFFHQLFVAARDAGQLRSDLDLPTIRMLLFGAMNWTAEWFRPDGPRPASSVIDQLLDLVFVGITHDPVRERG